MQSRVRPRITVTVAPDMLKEVDSYVQEHEGIDRSQVIDDALRRWYTSVVRDALARQRTTPKSPEELEERTAWKRIRAAQIAHADHKHRAPLAGTDQ